MNFVYVLCLTDPDDEGPSHPGVFEDETDAIDFGHTVADERLLSRVPDTDYVAEWAGGNTTLTLAAVPFTSGGLPS